MFQADTIEQYKLYKFIKENFYMDSITITKVDYRSLKVTDQEKEDMIFSYQEDKVVSIEQLPEV